MMREGVYLVEDKTKKLFYSGVTTFMVATHRTSMILNISQKHKISIKCYYLINYDGILLLLLNKLLYLDIIVDMNLLD
jgi:hypothetical protein